MKKITKKMVDSWYDHFIDADSKSVFSREVIKYFKSESITLLELQTYINLRLHTPLKELSKTDRYLVDTYKCMEAERKAAIEEDLLQDRYGMLHLSKAQLGNSEKSEVKVESESLSDILKK